MWLNGAIASRLENRSTGKFPLTSLTWALRTVLFCPHSRVKCVCVCVAVCTVKLKRFDGRRDACLEYTGALESFLDYQFIQGSHFYVVGNSEIFVSHSALMSSPLCVFLKSVCGCDCVCVSIKCVWHGAYWCASLLQMALHTELCASAERLLYMTR